MYRALEIKRHKQSIKTGTTKLKADDSPRQTETKILAIERSKLEEISGPLEDEDYEMLLETYKEEENERQEMTENEIINDMISKIMPSVAPK